MSQYSVEYSFDGKSLKIIDSNLKIHICYEELEPRLLVLNHETEIEHKRQEIQKDGWLLLKKNRLCLCEGREREVLYAEELYFNGLRHGPTRTYYLHPDKTQCATEGWYYEGQLHGRLQSWYLDGQIYQQSQYIHGKRAGTTKIWNSRGVLISSQPFKDGYPHGAFQTFNPRTTVLARNTDYREGRRDGIDFLFHGDDGFLLFCDEWKLGEKKRVILDDLLDRNLHASIERSKQQSNTRNSS